MQQHERNSTPGEDGSLKDNTEHVEMDMENSNDDANTYDVPVDTSGHTRHAPTTTRLLPHIGPQPPPSLPDENNSESSRHYDDSPQTSRRSRSNNFVFITNISPTVTIEQMRSLLSILGDIVDLKMFHFDKSSELNFKVCFVEYSQHSSVLMALHLTNTIFIDRALIVMPYKESKLPLDKETATIEADANVEYVTNFNTGVATQVAIGPNKTQVITTSDSRLAALNLQTYPQLPINTDPTRVEEIRRTLYIGNLDSSVPHDQVMKFFSDFGEVKYIRIAGDETQATRFAFVEYTHQSSLANALPYNGSILGSRALKINHSNNPIVKPQPKLEIEGSYRKLRDNRSRESKRRSSRRDRNGDRSRRYDSHYDRRGSPRRSRRSRSRERERSRRRSRDYASSRSRSRDEIIRRRSRSKDSRKRRSRSRSIERRSKHKRRH